jgi:uncharacterized protein (DUF608 family)
MKNMNPTTGRMQPEKSGRSFLWSLLAGALVFTNTGSAQQTAHRFNGSYDEAQLEHVAYPVGGMGAGMFCLEGTGAISHFSIRHAPDVFNEPPFFAAISVKGDPEKARVLEGPVPSWKKYGQKDAALGQPGATWGLARFRQASFKSRFPFAEIKLKDRDLPVTVTITGWSPFIPTDQDNSSLPVGALEYNFTNTGAETKDLVFSYNAELSGGFKQVESLVQGFILSDTGSVAKQQDPADFAVFTGDANAVIDHTWFRSGWWDPLTMCWNRIKKAEVQAYPPDKDPRGASLMVPFTLKPGQQKKIIVYMAWYVPNSHLRVMDDASDQKDFSVRDESKDLPSPYYKPWYSSRFKNIGELANYWRSRYEELKKNTGLFTDAFYRSTLPPEVTEAVAANLSILKSPTVMRQYDGRFWGWEGCEDSEGSCPGSCTHVWNYAQALSHLFPAMERSLRETEFNESQNTEGRQMFRSALPIRPIAHNFYAASDGQLGGIMKVYRDWRIYGDSLWLLRLYPKVKLSMDYCIGLWDPRHTGTLEEPHHNTYDIEFWGPDGMCTGMYLGALESMIRISDYLNKDSGPYHALLEKGRLAIAGSLFNGKYFYQKTRWQGLSAADPVEASKNSMGGDYSGDALEMLKREGPKYQYGDGCLSDGAIGAWMATVCGLPAPYDTSRIKSHLASVYQYNFKTDLSGHSNPQRPTYALGNEGGLLLCSWPRQDKLSLPFPYSDEVWTGIEYEVASHLIFVGNTAEGLEIVRTARKRYDGSVRNPFDEYECGHWYARAMSSYALIEALTGVRYDAVTKTLYVHSRIGDFTSFLSTNTGFGNLVYKNGKASLQVVYGSIDVKKVVDQSK